METMCNFGHQTDELTDVTDVSYVVACTFTSEGADIILGWNTCSSILAWIVFTWEGAQASVLQLFFKGLNLDFKVSGH